MLRPLMSMLVCLAALVATMPTAVAQEEDAPELTEPYFGQERVGGKYLPDPEPAATRLVVLLHGYGQSVDEVVDAVPLRVAAAAYGWLLVVPSGLEDRRGWPYWNATPTCCGIGRLRNDDVAYLRDLIVDHLDRYRIPDRQVTVVGLSNGGFMAYQLACHAADVVTSVVVISGSERERASDCRPQRPVSVLHVHGLFDRAVFFAGGSIGVAPAVLAPYPGAAETVDRWADRNGCRSSPVSVEAARGERGRWSFCDASTTVEYWWLPDGHRVELDDAVILSIVAFIEAQNRPLAFPR